MWFSEENRFTTLDPVFMTFIATLSEPVGRVWELAPQLLVIGQSIHFKSFELFSKVIQRMFRKVQFPCQSHTQITPLTCFTAPLRVLVYLNEYGGKIELKSDVQVSRLGYFPQDDDSRIFTFFSQSVKTR